MNNLEKSKCAMGFRAGSNEPRRGATERIVKPTISAVHVAAMMIVSCLLNAAPLHAQATFMPLGVFEGLRSEATDVSADGSVVVGTVFAPAPILRDHVFVWTSTDSVVRTGNFRGSPAISGDGSTVAGSIFAPPTQAFRFRVEGDVQLLGGLPGEPTGSDGFDVSADGSAVVGVANTTSGDEAFRWTEATGMVGLGDLPGGQSRSIAFGVSADGAVVVGEGYGADDRPEAFRWTEAGMIALGRLPGGVSSRARSVSGDGAVVVGISNYPSSPVPLVSRYEAFRWTEAGGMVGLGDLPGGVLRSEALDVSADGSVVVGSAFTLRPDGSTREEAFFWTEATGMVALRDALIAMGVTTLDDSILFNATGVSADGLTIVGTAFHEGQRQAFLATIPEPSTIMMAMIGAAAATGLYVRQLRRTGSTGEQNAKGEMGKIEPTGRM
jgi:probable HAF family extracellular repeat protein